jgi:hypothetical protein
MNRAKIAVVGIAGLSMLCLTAPAAPLQPDASLVFYAPFDGTATATFSNGGNGIPVTASGIRFVEGIRGQAVHVGGNGDAPAALEYDATGLFQAETGTVMFWVRPDWDGYFTELDQNNIYPLFSADSGTDSRVKLFMWHWLRCDFKDAVTTTPIMVEQRCRFAWMRGDWWHIALTWERGKDKAACLYVNGVQSAQAADLNLADTQRFAVGSAKANAAFDEFSLRRRALAPAEIMAIYRESAPWDYALERRYLRADRAEELVLELAPGQGSPTRLAGRLTLRLLADADGRVVTQLPAAAIKGDKRQTVTLPVPALPEGAYRLECVLTTAAARWQRSFPVTVYRQRKAPPSSRQDVARGEPLASIDCTKEENGFIASGPTQVKALASGAAYREAGSGKWDRFAYEVAIPGADGTPVLLEVTWPDDGERAMGLYMIVESKSVQHRDRLAGGIQCGGEYANSAAMQVTRYLFYPSAERYLFEVRTLVPGLPAAVAKLDIYRVGERLPKLAVTAPPGLPARRLGHLDEDQSFEMLMAPLDSRFPKSPLPYGYPVQVIEQLLDYFDYTGQQGMSYALLRYFWSHPDAGPINNTNTSLRSTGWVLLLLDMMAARGQYLLGSINLWTVPLPPGCPDGLAERISQDYFSRDRDGKPTVQGELPLAGFGTETAGFGNNPTHPAVRDAFFEQLNELLRRYGQHPAFAGLELWCAPSSPFLFGSLEQGYDDRTVSEFEKDTGLRVPAAAGEGRFAARYTYLTGPQRPAWLAWRAARTSDLLTAVDRALRRCRKDLRLHLNLSGWYGQTEAFLGQTQSEDVDLSRYAYEALSLDLPRLKQLSTVTLAPEKDATYYRWIKHWYGGKESITTELNWNVEKFRVFRNAGRNATAIYLRYFESFMKSLKQDVYQAYFQSADAKAWGRNFLQDPAVALASQDADWILVGAQPIGTSGRDAEAREFALAYGALPAIPFRDVPGLADPVTVRYAHTRNGTYVYAVSLLGSPLTLDLTLPATAGTVTDLSSGTPMPAPGQSLTIALQPFQLRSFLLSGKRAEPFSGQITIPTATREAYAASTTALAALLTQVQDLGVDAKPQAERLAVIQERLATGAYAEAHRLLISRWMRELPALRQAADAGYLKEQQAMLARSEYAVNCGSTAFYRATSGKLFLPDATYTPGGYGKVGARATSVTRSSVGLTGSADPELFATEAYDMDGYRFTVKPGTYTVRLHWKVGYEPGAKPGVFIFSLDIEGQRVLTDYDVFMACGQQFNQAMVAEFKGVKVSDGVLDLGFAVNPGVSTTARLCNAIEVIPEP